ncbi:IclR family transcriptional regulator [Microbacterium sp. A93]|uniref:IclR family transcriptional regulator n=1 Tax=Microbacterium sp. A93 TaxID=3450716 RepID=UPI003F42CF16
MTQYAEPGIAEPEAQELVPRSVVERALRILGSFDNKHAQQTISEISRRTGLPLTTSHRIVAELTDSGALERQANGEYHVGLRLWEIAAHAPRSVGLQRVALPFMQDLSETTHFPVHLSIREQEEAVFVERLVPVGSADERPRVGARYPLHVTAVGMAMLAFAPPEIQESVLAKPLQRFTPYTETAPERLRQLLAQVRHEGLAVGDRQINVRYVAVAVPIFAPDGSARAALSLIIPHAESDRKPLGYMLRAASKGISRVLRHGGDLLPTPEQRT